MDQILSAYAEFRTNVRSTDKSAIGQAVSRQIHAYIRDYIQPVTRGSMYHWASAFYWSVQEIVGTDFGIKPGPKAVSESIGRLSDYIGAGESQTKALALYFWFHVATPYREFAEAIDKDLFDGQSYEDHFQHKLPRLWTRDTQAGDGPALDKQHSGDNRLVRQFEELFERWGIRNPKDHAENAFSVIQSNLGSEPFEFEQSIIGEAQRQGLFNSELEQQVFENRVRTGSKSFQSKISSTLSSLATDSLSAEPRALDPAWVAELAPNFENPEFINEQIDICAVAKEPEPHKLHLLDILDANLRGIPYTDAVRSPIGLLNGLLKANQTGATKNFLMLTKAKYLLLNGNSENAIQTFEAIVDSPFFDERQKIDAHYNFLNASFGLRLPEHYGTARVSTVLRDVDLTEFDANDQIERFCAIYGIDPENSNERTIHDSTRQLGASAAKIIYFYYLEKILRSGTDSADFNAYLDEILTMLRVLSNTRRPGKSHGYYVKEAWYPLVFLYCVSYQFGRYESMERLDHLMMTFEGWAQAKTLREDVEQEFKDGNLLTLIHSLNKARFLRKSGKAEEAKPILLGLRDHFYTTSIHPAISQTLNFHLKDAGLEYDGVHDTASQRKIAVSHRNYIIDFDSAL